MAGAASLALGILTAVVTRAETVQLGNTVAEVVETTLVKRQENAYGILTYTFTTPEEWSGHGGDWSGWYLMRTPPAPPGYRVFHQSFELVGDKDCQEADRDITEDHGTSFVPKVIVTPAGTEGVSLRTWYVHCALVQNDGSVVAWMYQMQGHSENKHVLVDLEDELRFRQEGTAATSRGTAVVRYIPGGHSKIPHRGRGQDPPVDCSRTGR